MKDKLTKKVGKAAKIAKKMSAASEINGFNCKMEDEDIFYSDEEFSDSEEGPRDFLVTVRCSPKACLSNYRVFMAVMNQFYMPKMVR